MKWMFLGVSLCLIACGDDSQQEIGDAGTGSGATDEATDPSSSAESDDPSTDDLATDDQATTEQDTDSTDPGPDPADDTTTDGTEPTDGAASDAEEAPTDQADAGTPEMADAGGDTPNGDAGAEQTDTPPDEPEPIEPISVEEFCDGLRAAWLERCALAERDDCAAVDAMPGALSCALAPSAVGDGMLAFDGSAAAECLMDENLDVLGAWEGSYLSGTATCWNVFQAAAALGEPCALNDSFASTCIEGYCPYSGAFEGVCVEYAAEGESCADVFCGSGDLYCSGEQVCAAILEDGAACDDPSQCRSRSCYEGSCVVPAALGEDCSATVCTYPYACKADVCVEKVEEGDVCTLQQQCPDTLSCIYASPGAAEQSCAQLPEDGDPCDPRSGCAGDEVYCEETAEPGVGVCDAFYSEEGEPCGNGIGDCRPELYCVQNEGSTTEGTCAPDHALEEACGDIVWQSLGNNPCVDGLLCMFASTDTCLPPGELGDPCFYNSEATCADEGTYCSYQTRLCELPVGLGERCNLAFPERSCEEGLCLLVPAADCSMAPLGDCQDSLCVEPFDNGTECTYSGQCASGFCDVSLDVPVCAAE